MAKIRTIGISGPLIARTIGVARGDNGALCTSNNIKMWSYRKPFNRVPEGNYSDKYVYTMEERDLAISHYGLMYIPVVRDAYSGQTNLGEGYMSAGLSPGDWTEEELKKKWKYRYEVFDDANSGQGQIDANGVFYGKPCAEVDGKIEYTLQHNDGSETKVSYHSRARQSDFREYDHASIAPVTSTGLQKILNENGTLSEYKIVIRVRRTPANSTYGGLTVDNWVPYYEIFGDLNEKAASWKLGVGLYDVFGRNLYTFFKPDGVTGSLDQTNAFVSLGSPASDFSDFTFRMSAADFNVLMGQHEWGFFSVVPFLVRKGNVSFLDNTNKLNPVFYYVTDNRLAYQNHMLLLHDCRWPLTQINKQNIAWYGAEEISYIGYSADATRMYIDFLYVPTDGVTNRLHALYIPLKTAFENYIYDGTIKRRLAQAFGTKEFMIQATKDFKDTITTNKRTVLIGDYYVGQYYLSPSSVAKDYSYKPLIDVKVKYSNDYGEFVVDGQIVLAYMTTGLTYLMLVFNFGNISKAIIPLKRNITGNNAYTFKTLVFQNLVNEDTNEIEGLCIRGINIQWSEGWSGVVKDNNEYLSNIEESTGESAFWFRNINAESPLTYTNEDYGTTYKVVPYIPTSVETNAYVFSNKYDVNTSPNPEDDAYQSPFTLLESAYHPYVHISNGGVDDDIPEMLSFGSTEWEAVTE